MHVDSWVAQNSCSSVACWLLWSADGKMTTAAANMFSSSSHGVRRSMDAWCKLDLPEHCQGG